MGLLESCVVTWVVAEWTQEQASIVAERAGRVMSLGSSETVEATEVASAVMELLEAVDAVVLSHVDRSEVLVVAMQSGEGVHAIVSVLEHGLEVLDGLTVVRKDRRRLLGVCEEVEGMVERLVVGDVAEQLSASEVSELSRLSECLCAVETVKTREAGTEYLEVVSSSLEELKRWCDP